MKVDFKRLTWENYPSTETPINADNLNRLEEGVAGLYSDLRDIEQELDGGVGEHVTKWLNEHVDPVGSAVVVDDTLSIEGAAADAKKTGDELTSLKEEITDIIDSAYVTDTASGSIASFPDGADNVPAKSLTVNIEPVQEGSGDPSPTNIRPISGRTQAVVTRTGKNLLPFVNSTSTQHGVTVKGNSDGTYSWSGTATSNNAVQFNVTVPITHGVYRFISSADIITGVGNVSLYYTDITGTEKVLYPDRTIDLSTSKNIRIAFFTQAGATINLPSVELMLIRESETDTTFEPYTAQTVTIDLGGTIYGGTLDVTTGVLTVDRTIKSSGWSRERKDSSGKCWLIGETPGCIPYDAAEVPSRSITSHFACNSLENIRTNNSGLALFYRSAWVAGYGDNSDALDTILQTLEVVYPLSTPQTYQLTPQEVTTLLSQNNIFSDAGTVDVEYRADTKLYIEKLTAPTEDDMIADHAISANSFFMVGNTLYRATTAIASGATITVGTNATKLSLSDALNALS